MMCVQSSMAYFIRYAYFQGNNPPWPVDFGSIPCNVSDWNVYLSIPNTIGVYCTTLYITTLSNCVYVFTLLCDVLPGAHLSYLFIEKKPHMGVFLQSAKAQASGTMKVGRKWGILHTVRKLSSSGFRMNWSPLPIFRRFGRKGRRRKTSFWAVDDWFVFFGRNTKLAKTYQI